VGSTFESFAPAAPRVIQASIIVLYSGRERRRNSRRSSTADWPIERSRTVAVMAPSGVRVSLSVGASERGLLSN
jgi:hypothetical protein